MMLLHLPLPPQPSPPQVSTKQLQTHTGDTVDRHNFAAFIDACANAKVKGEACKSSPLRGCFVWGRGGAALWNNSSIHLQKLGAEALDAAFVVCCFSS